MKNARLWAGILVLCLLMTFVVGCTPSGGQTSTPTPPPDTGGEPAPAEPTPAPAPAEGKTTLKFYFWDENQKGIMQGMADAFMEKNSNIIVECTVIPVGDYHTQLKVSVPSGSGPDVFWINKNDLDIKDYIAPIQDDLAQAGVNTSNFVSAIVELFTQDGNLYGVPKDVDAPLLFYNKAMFDEAGVAYPTNEWKWDDLKETAIKLTGDGKYGVGLHAGMYDGIYNYMPCNGAPVYSDDRKTFTGNIPAGVEALQFMLDMIYVDGSSPTQAEMVELSAEDMFVAGLTAMHMGGSWWIPWFHDVHGENLGLALVPYSTERVYQSNGLAFARSNNGANQEAAREFQMFLASEEGQKIQSSYLIPALKGSEGKWLESFSDIDASALPMAFDYCIPMYFADKNRGEIDTKFQEVCNNIWMQSISPADGLAQLDQEINALLQ